MPNESEETSPRRDHARAQIETDAYLQGAEGKTAPSFEELEIAALAIGGLLLFLTFAYLVLRWVGG